MIPARTAPSAAKATEEARTKLRRSIPKFISIAFEVKMERILLLLLIHAASTLYMVGLIWFVQLVHYRLMSRVGPAAYPDYQRAHQSLTSLAVGPAMLVELIASLSLAVLGPRDPFRWLGFGAVVALWASTALVQMPLHATLADGFDAPAHARLVSTNWLRTGLWSLRGALALWLIVRAWRSP